MAWVKSGTVNQFRIDLGEGEPLEVTNNLQDVLAWERAHKKPWQANVDNSSLLWVAWKAARRLDLTHEVTADQFLARVVDYEVFSEDEDDAEDPTQTDQSES